MSLLYSYLDVQFFEQLFIPNVQNFIKRKECIEMDITNLKSGDIIKNYKELCILIQEEIKDGNAKKAQLKEFERHFKYEKRQMAHRLLR